MQDLKYNAAAIQTSMTNPLSRAGMKRNTARICTLIDRTVVGYAPFLPIRLLVFPEFSHAAPAYDTLKELRESGGEDSNEHTEAVAAKAREYSVYVQTGTLLEIDRKVPSPVQYDLPDRAGESLQVSEGYIPGSLGGAHDPHDIEGYERNFPGCEDSHWECWGCGLLRLAVPGDTAPIDRKRS